VLVILNFDLTERDAEMDTPLRRDHETPLRKHDETFLRKHDETPLRGVRPNIVQSIRAFRVQDLQDAATQLNQHFLYANLGNAQSKQDLLDMIAAQYTFPAHFGKNFDALYDCMTDLVHKSGPQPGFIVVLEQIPAHAKFDKEAREQLLDIFRDAADYWADRKIPFRCFYSFL
jgi:RNAse (barnase) inhibitor barstar